MIVSIVPQAYFVSRIGGDLVAVQSLAPPNHSPETHQVTPRQMDLLGRASVYFRIGMPFETPLISRLESACPNLSIVDTREGVSLLSMEGHHHHHDDDHDHTHCGEGDDPHIWLDPLRVKIQAQTMARVLSEKDPAHESTFMANLADFEAELEGLHTWLQNVFAPIQGRIMYVFHPAFGYLADAYGLEQRAIEQAGKSPGSRRLYELIDDIKANNIRAIFEQPQFASGEVRVIAEETGAKVVLLDNLAYEYVSNMKEMARAIVAHLE